MGESQGVTGGMLGQVWVGETEVISCIKAEVMSRT